MCTERDIAICHISCCIIISKRYISLRKSHTQETLYLLTCTDPHSPAMHSVLVCKDPKTINIFFYCQNPSKHSKNKKFLVLKQYNVSPIINTSKPNSDNSIMKANSYARNEAVWCEKMLWVGCENPLSLCCNNLSDRLDVTISGHSDVTICHTD